MTRTTMLVPLDGSALAESALPYAATMAEAHGDALRLLAVVESLGDGAYAHRIEALVEEGLRAHVHEVAERLRARGLLVETAIRGGSPPDVIVAEAAAAPTRAIVLCTRGMTGLDRWLIGSVADKVVRLAPCPVLLVHPDGLAPDAPWTVRRLLVPLDGSVRAEQALPHAYALAADFGAEVRLVRVQPWATTQVAVYGGYIPDLAALDECAAQRSGEYLDRVCDGAPADLPVSRVVLRGSPAQQIAEYAEYAGADAIVIASRGHHGGRRLLLGSVTDRLIRQGLPVLVVHPLEPDADQAGSPAYASVAATDA